MDSMDWTELQIPPPSWHRECALNQLPDPEVALTTIVRQYYLRHLTNTVEENYRMYYKAQPQQPADVRSCVLHLERRALRACMVSDIYRRSMLNVINDIKNHTSVHKLHSDVLHVMQQSKACIPGSVGPFLTPPADFPSQLMTQELSLIEEKKNCPDIGMDNEIITEKALSGGSTIDASQPESISCLPHYEPSEHSPSRLCENRGEPEINIDWDQIEEDMAKVCGEIFFTEAMSGEVSLGEEMNLKISSVEGNDHVKLAVASMSQPQEDGKIAQKLREVQVQSSYWKKLRIIHEKELEQHHERLRRSYSLQRQAKVKKQIRVLFGPDELLQNAIEALTRQERIQYHERIAPWVVKHLMPVYKRGKITSKSSFKKAAKHISGSLMRCSLTPDECDVWMAVQRVFPTKKSKN